MPKAINGATLAGFLAVLLWSGSVALTRSLTEKLGALGAGAWVFTLSGALILAFELARNPGETRARFRAITFRYALVCGGMFMLYALAYNLAIGLAHDRRQAVELALLNYLWPALTILFSLAMRLMRASWGVYPGIGIALTGVFLVMTSGGELTWHTFAKHAAGNPVAYAAALAAGISWALYSVFVRRWAPSRGSSVSLFLLASGLVLGLVNKAFPFKAEPVSLFLIAETAALVVATAAAYGLWDLAMRRGQVARVAAVSYFAPVLSTFFSCAYLHVTPEPRLWIGSAFVAGGSIACWLSVREDA